MTEGRDGRASNFPPDAGLYAWPKDALRINFGIIWLIDAALKWLPGSRSGYMDTIMGEAKGRPGWLHPWFTFWINLQHPRSTSSSILTSRSRR